MRVGVSLALGAQRVPAGGAGGGWPAALDTGLLYRFDASDPDSLTLSGSNVTAWADLGPDGLDLTHSETGFPDPTYTETGFAGGPAVLFAQPGSDPLSRAGVAIDYSGTTTLALVYEPHATATSFSTVIAHLSGGGAGRIVREDNSESWLLSTVGYGDPRVRAATPPKAPQVTTITLGPAVATYERNGVDVTSSPSAGAGSSITGTLLLGAHSSVGVRACKGIALAACWDHALDSTERAALYAYCAARWTT